MVHLCESAASLQDAKVLPLENGDAAMREPSEDFFFLGGGGSFFQAKSGISKHGLVAIDRMMSCCPCHMNLPL